jgi:hypothetical protein
MTPDPIRKLAEEIAKGNMSWTPEFRPSPSHRRALKILTDRWEARLRAFLQDQQAKLLGEPAAMREALIRLIAVANASYTPAQLYEAANQADAALSGEAGKLAGEVIQAAKEINWEFLEQIVPREHVSLWDLKAAVDALLAAAGKEERNG